MFNFFKIVLDGQRKSCTRASHGSSPKQCPNQCPNSGIHLNGCKMIKINYEDYFFKNKHCSLILFKLKEILFKKYISASDKNYSASKSCFDTR